MLVVVPKILLHQLQANVAVVAKPNLNAIVLVLGLQGKGVGANMTAREELLSRIEDLINDHINDIESNIKLLEDQVEDLQEQLTNATEAANSHYNDLQDSINGKH